MFTSSKQNPVFQLYARAYARIYMDATPLTNRVRYFSLSLIHSDELTDEAHLSHGLRNHNSYLVLAIMDSCLTPLDTGNLFGI